ncbi:hypothetical protein Actkin_02335 [Actinokineospora sp. UTMC 2448]|nr:hypothetical protein Actkin_02335 [Actinokineospora sp. UTMC 2448]
MATTRIKLLDGEVCLCNDTGEQALTGPVLPRIVVELVAGTPGTVSETSLIDVVGSSREALQTNVSRLRRLGLDIARTGSGYRLVTTGVGVDALEFLEVARTNRQDLSAERVQTALALWRNGPTRLLGSTAMWNALHEAKATLEAHRARFAPKRLLIVEDQVGDRLCEVLGEYDCTVVQDLPAFWRLLPDLEDNFDAALVDLHLRPDYVDRDGEVVIGAITSSTAVPVIMMTYKLPGGMNVTEFRDRYNLVAVVTKLGDGPGVDLNNIVTEVRRLFGGDVREKLLAELEDRLPGIRRRALKQLRLAGAMDREPMVGIRYDQVSAIAQKGDLADLRRAVDAFEKEFGLRVGDHR